MNSRRLCSSIGDTGTPTLALRFLCSSSTTCQIRSISLRRPQHRALSSSRHLFAPESAPQSSSESAPSPSTSSASSSSSSPPPRSFGQPLTIRPKSQGQDNDFQTREILSSLTSPRKPPSASSSSFGDATSATWLTRSRYNTPTERAQTALAQQYNNNTLNILSSDDRFRRIKPELPPRMDAFMGRAVPVDKRYGLDFGRALQVLSRTLTANDVRGMFRKQKFHERPGLKRKRLRRERWRKRFMGGFRALVTKVGVMKAQGW